MRANIGIVLVALAGLLLVAGACGSETSTVTGPVGLQGDSSSVTATSVPTTPPLSPALDPGSTSATPTAVEIVAAPALAPTPTIETTAAPTATAGPTAEPARPAPSATLPPAVSASPVPPPSVAAATPSGSQDALVANGAEVYTLNCARCHAENGTGTERYSGLIGVGSRYSSRSMIAELTNGHPVTFGFADRLSADEIASVVAYVKARFP